VQVGVEAFEARVEIGGDRHEQDLYVWVVETEGPGDPAEPEIGPTRLRELRLALDPGHRRRQLIHPIRQEADMPLQEIVNLGVGDVQAAKAVVRIRIGRPAPVDGRPDARLDHREPAEQVDE
jgi:hypothetical protein